MINLFLDFNGGLHSSHFILLVSVFDKFSYVHFPLCRIISFEYKIINVREKDSVKFEVLYDQLNLFVNLYLMEIYSVETNLVNYVKISSQQNNGW